MKLTVAKYYAPKGHDIHKKGITPDVVVDFTEQDIKNKNDVQLKKAIEVLNQKIQACR